MRFTTIAVGMLFAAAPLLAQEVLHRRVEVNATAAGPVGGAVSWVGDGSAPADAVYLHGAGIRFEGAPKKGAPYSAEAVTETVQALADGNRIRRENRSKIYRDSEGRTRREEKLDAVGPWAVAGDSPTRIFINDPVAGVHWVLEPENKIARKMKMPSLEEHLGVAEDVTLDVHAELREGDASAKVARRIEERRLVIEKGSIKSSGEQPKVEDLGSRMIEGVEAKGEKITRIIPAGQIGNDRPIEVVFEQWRSEELGVDVMTKRSDPRSAETTYKLTNIQQTEPLPGLFEPPPDYEVKEDGGQVLIRKIETKEAGK